MKASYSIHGAQADPSCRLQQILMDQSDMLLLLREFLQNLNDRRGQSWQHYRAGVF